MAVLSNLAQVFDLLDVVKKIVERRKQQMDPSQEQVLGMLTSEYRTQTRLYFRAAKFIRILFKSFGIEPILKNNHGFR